MEYTVCTRGLAVTKLIKMEEGKEMKTAMGTTKVNMRIRDNFAIKMPVRLLGGLALGALLMAGTAILFGPVYADERARPLAIEQLGDLPEIFQTEIWLPGDTYPAAWGGTEDLPGLVQTEIWLPGDSYPVSGARSDDLPPLLQTEVWLPGDTYPTAFK